MPKKPSGKSAAVAAAPTPRMGTEKAMRGLQHLLEGKDFASIEDINAFLASPAGRGQMKSAGREALTAKEQAQEFAWNAMETESGAKARKLARRALALDADCVDALVMLAELEAKTPDERIAGLQAAVAAGERSLGAGFFRQNRGHFWLLMETRPYMRAMARLAEAMRGHAMFADAIRIFETMLELNPNDNQGVRDPLLYLYLETDNLRSAQKLLKEYNDGSASFKWARVLERFLSGDHEGASKALKQARKANRHIELFLTLRESASKEAPEMYSPGSKEEAVLVLNGLCGALLAQQEACSWILDQLAADGLRPAPSRNALKRMKVVGKKVQ